MDIAAAEPKSSTEFSENLPGRNFQGYPAFAPEKQRSTAK